MTTLDVTAQQNNEHSVRCSSAQCQKLFFRTSGQYIHLLCPRCKTTNIYKLESNERIVLTDDLVC